MIRCKHCKSYAVRDTGKVLTSYPSQTVYYCKNCGKEFSIINETIYALDKAENVTASLKLNFIDSILKTGEIPYRLNYCGQDYGFLQAENDKYYYANKQNSIYLDIPKLWVSEADGIFESIQDLWERIK